MLTVVVDSYSKVKDDIDFQQTDCDIFSDYYWSTINGFRGVLHRWPADLPKKLQTQLVARAVSESHLANALNISHTTAKSIVDAYSHNKAIRYNREASSNLDKMLLKRAALTLGFDKTYKLLESNMTKIQMNGIDTKHVDMATKIDNIAAQQEFFRQEVLELLRSPASTNSKESPLQKLPAAPSIADLTIPRCGLVLPFLRSFSALSPHTRVATSQEPVHVSAEAHNAIVTMIINKPHAPSPQPPPQPSQIVPSDGSKSISADFVLCRYRDKAREQSSAATKAIAKDANQVSGGAGASDCGWA